MGSGGVNLLRLTFRTPTEDQRAWQRGASSLPRIGVPTLIVRQSDPDVCQRSAEDSTYGVSVAAVLKQIRAAAVSEDATRSAPTDDASGAVLLMLLESPDHTGDTDVVAVQAAKMRAGERTQFA